MKFFLPKFRKNSRPYCSAVVVAAGTAQRMQGVDKIMAEVGGLPVIVRTLQALQNCPDIDEVVVVTRSELIVPIGTLCGDFNLDKVKKIVLGGEDRPHSVLNGLSEIDKKAELVAIHDGARPFVTQAVLQDVITAAGRGGAAAPAVPLTDTIKTATDGVVTGTPDRATLFAVQTPQVFDADLLRGALHYCVERNVPITDDCSAVEQLGKQVALVSGSEENIKITTPFDLIVGEAIAQCRDAI